MTLATETSASPTRSPGRPRQFDIDQALDRAIDVFSERGYQGASITELKAAMNLASGSLYKAFRNKRDIFLAAFERYKTMRDEALMVSIGSEGDGRARIARYLAHYAASVCGRNGRKGCLVISSAMELALFDDEAAARISAAMTRNEAMLGKLIREGQHDGSINPALDVAATARLLLCVTQGMRVVAKTGFDRNLAAGVVDNTLKALD